MAIANNKKGYDYQILKMFKERTWNNPVVRFINADKSDVVDKIHRDWSVKRLTGAMVETLKSRKREVPHYLAYINSELQNPQAAAKMPKLAASALRFLPMPVPQQAAVEKALQAGEDPAKHLSPTQLKILEIIKTNSAKEWPEVNGKDFLKGWNEFAAFYSKQGKK